MGLKKLAEKVDDYNERLERGKSERIKPHHVEKVLKKLKKKTSVLKQEIKDTSNENRKIRLEKKLKIAREHIERAEWLLKQIA